MFIACLLTTIYTPTMKSTKITFWVTTIIIFLFEGLMPALTSQSELAKEGIRHLGYPEYFGTLLTIFKVVGAVGLVLPMIKGVCKEWIYAGFAFDFIFAFLSLLIVDGVTPVLLAPVVCMVLLAFSYKAYHKLNPVAVAPTL